MAGVIFYRDNSTDFIMQYPFWLPKPRKHWLRAIILGLLSIPVCLIFFVVMRLGGAISLAMLINEQVFNVWIVLWLAALVLIPPYVLAHFHQFFRDDPREDLPAWLPRYRCFRRGIVDWLVFILAILAALILCIDWEIIANGSPLQVERHIENRVVWLNTTWVVSAAYLFYLGDAIGWFLGEVIKLPYALVGKKRKPKQSEKKE